MKYRYAKILAAEAANTAGTKTIDLDIVDVLSRIDIRWKVTKSKNDMDAHPAADITKIELVDGSDVLHSLSGYENQALAIYSRKVGTMNHGQHTTSNAEESAYGIDFGRYLWDTLLAFDPKRFRNPQLRITHNLALSDAGVSVAELEVLGHFFDEKAVSPMGFLMAKEHFSYTPGSDTSYEHVDLPTDYLIRQILVRAYRDGYEPWNVIDEARLDEENLKRIPFDHDNLENYCRLMKGVWTPVQEQFIAAPTTTGEYYYLTPTDYYAILVAMTIGTASDWFINAATCRGGKAYLRSPATQTGHGIAFGWLPNHCYQFPFGMQDDPDDWYDVTKLSKPRLRLRAAAGGSSGTGEVVLEQLRRY